MTTGNSKYIVYAVRELRPSIFGETYAIATGTEFASAQFIAEYFILTQRPSEDLDAGSLQIGGKVPPELGVIDVDFALEEAYQQAEIDLSSMLENRANQLGHQELAFAPFELRQRL